MNPYADLIEKNPYAEMASRVDQIPGNVTPLAQIPSSTTPMLGALDAALAAGTGLFGGMVGQVAGVGRSLLGGKLGTAEGVRSGEETARDVSRALTYRPRTETGQGLLEGLAGLLDATKLSGLPPAEGVTLANLLPQAARQAASKIPALPTREPAPMVGMGSAMTDIDRLRNERAQQLPVPLPLTKGMLSRDFEQQRFERETAKAGPIGEPLRERHADLNQKILQNFDAFVEQTGAESGGLRATGQIVNDVIVNKAKIAKGQINAAYEKARQSGEMQQPVSVAPLLEYVESHRPEAINAPIIASLEAKVNAVAKNGAATVNDLEEVRKMVGALSGKDATNAHFGKEINGLIDGLTEGAGGDAYKRARSLRLKYAKEFEDVGVIDKMMSTKPGTRDRAVAYEDVFSHSILKGSLDDVRSVRKTLQTAGADGQQAWRELQGQTVQHIKDEMTKSATTDVRGNTVASADKLNRVIRELDKDGKLDFVFGKQGAQQMRDITEAAKDVLTFPPGSVNTSNTTSVLLGALGNAAVGRMPTAAAQLITTIRSAKASNAMKKRVAESLAPPQDQP